MTSDKLAWNDGDVALRKTGSNGMAMQRIAGSEVRDLPSEVSIVPVRAIRPLVSTAKVHRLIWACALGVSGALSGVASAQGVPAFKLVRGIAVAPGDVATYYTSATAHSNSVPGYTRPVELTELGNGLGAASAASNPSDYAARVFQYVYVNIENDWMFGLSKGALGAVLDQSGTAFDQAQLMVDLLGVGGVAASFRYGTVTVTGAEFQTWSGITSAIAACRLLADGGIPSAINGVTRPVCDYGATDTVASVQITHVWVTANGIDYDPSIKRRTFKIGINLSTALGCVGTSTSCAAGIRSTVTPSISTLSGNIPSALSVNQTNVDGAYKIYATNLQTQIQNNTPAAELDDVIGGSRIDLATVPSTYKVPSTGYAPALLWSAIPDKYRATIRIRYDSIDKTVFADEVYGRLLAVRRKIAPNDIDKLPIHTPRVTELYSENTLLASSTQSDGTMVNSVLTLTVDHPYAAPATSGGTAGTYMDETLVQNNWALAQLDTVSFPTPTYIFMDTSILHAWGRSGVAASKRPAELNMQGGSWSKYTPAAVQATWLAQNSRMLNILGEVNRSAITSHHVIGSVTTAPVLGSAINVAASISIISRTNDDTDRVAASLSAAALSSRLEGSMSEQNEDAWDGFSLPSLFSRFNEKAVRFLYITSSNLTAATSRLTTGGYPSSVVSALSSTLTSSTDGVIAPASWAPGSFTFPALTGSPTTMNVLMGGFLAYRSDGSRASYAVGDPISKGALGSSAGIDPQAEVLKTVELSESARQKLGGVDVGLAAGNLRLNPEADLRTGTGEFPTSLSFQRYYDSAENALPTSVDPTAGSEWSAIPGFGSQLGFGWDYSFNIRAKVASQAMQAMGDGSALDASAIIATVYILRELNKGTQDLATALSTVFGAHWWGSSLRNNAVVVDMPPAHKVFVRLPDGTYNMPKGSGERIVQTGSRFYRLYSAGPVPVYTGVAFDLTNPDGSTIHFDTQFWRMGLFKPTAWSFPDGNKITFGYISLPGSEAFCLKSVSNNLGRSLTFDTFGPLPGGNPPSDFRSQGSCQIRGVTDDANRSVTYGSTFPLPAEYWSGVFYPAIGNFTFSVTTPDGETKYHYSVSSVDNKPDRFFAAIDAIYSPTDGNNPLVSFTYDSLYRVKTRTNVFGTINYRIGSIADTEAFRSGDALDPAGAGLVATTTQYFDAHAQMVQSIDPLGRATSKAYDGLGRVTRTMFPEGNYDTFTYDVRSNPLSVTHSPKSGSTLSAPTPELTTYVEGQTVRTCATAATCNRPATTTNSNGFTTNYWYRPNGQIQRIRGPAVSSGKTGTGGLSGRSQSDYCYQSYTAANSTSVSLISAAIVKETATKNRVASYVYNTLANHRVLQNAVVDPATTYIPPSTAGGACTTGTKSLPLGLTVAFVFDPVGNVSSINGPIPGTGDTTSYIFDSRRRLTTVVGPTSIGSKTRYCYDADGLLVGTYKARTASPADPNAATANSTGRCSSPFSTGLLGSWLGQKREYYPSGDLLSVTDDENNKTVYAYDEMSRRRVTQDPDGRQVATAYDLAGQTVATWRGGTTWLTGAGTATRPNTADSVPGNRAPDSSTTWTASSYAGSGKFRYSAHTFTLNGKEDTVLDAKNNKTIYRYDGLDRLQYMFFTDPDTQNSFCAAAADDSNTAAPTCTAKQTYEKYFYDNNGNRTRLHTRRNQDIDFDFNEAGVVWQKRPASQGAVQTGRDLAGDLLQVTKAANGSNVQHTTVYAYDAAGRRASETNDGRTVGYQFNEAGARRRTTWPDFYFVEYGFDDLVRMTSALENGTVPLAIYGLDALSRRSSLQFAGTTTNSIGYTFEADSDVDVITQALNGVTVTLDHAHNKSHQINNIIANDGFYLPSPVVSASVSFVPNALNQYDSVNGGAATYDLTGNLLTWFPRDGSGKQTFTYDSENRLETAAVNGSSAATISYDYDGLGRRVSKKVGGLSTYFLLDADEELAEYDSAGALLRRYIMGPTVDDRIATAEGGATSNPPKTYYHVNHQGSVIAMTDSAGNASGCAAGLICQRMSYDEYGNLGSGSSTTGQPYRYTGRRFDAETGLYYYRARYYSPGLGRFLQVDPIGYKDDVNLYAYVGNSPLDRVDPSGTYGRGDEWPDDEWDNFNRPQKRLARDMERKAAKLENQAANLEKKGKAGADDLRTGASNLRKGAADLKGDAKKAHFVDQAKMDSMEGCKGAAACADVGGDQMWVSKDAPNWKNGGIVFDVTLGHESLHTGAGLEDLASTGSKSYKFGNPSEQSTFKQLMGTPEGYTKPDNLMELVYPRWNERERPDMNSIKLGH